MKKCLSVILVFFFIISAAYAQPATQPVIPPIAQQPASQSAGESASLVQQMDSTVKTFAGDIHKKLIEKRVQKIAVGQFVHRGSIPPLGSYWVNQLTGELANTPNRSYVVLSGLAGADWTISGEIVEVADIIRVFTRLVRSEDRAVEAAFQSDFEKSPALLAMLVVTGGSRSSSVLLDEWEIDSWDNPAPYEIGAGENAAVINRTIHDDNDEDFFLFVPDRYGRLVMETTGDIDTYMEFYSADNRQSLEQNDDGGSHSNARIRYSVQSGRRYIAKVRGYGGATGSYGFRASFAVRASTGSWDNPVSCEIGADESAALINRSFQNEDDEDFFLLVPDRDGRLVMETTGNIDTCMTFYNADTREELASDDDGGSSYNARIRYSVQAGRRYIAKVSGYDGEIGDYGFRAYLSVPALLSPDEYESDDDPFSAKMIIIGSPRQYTFHHPDDVDWVKFQITQSGRYTIRTRGVNSNHLDTYIELFDANMNAVAEDDDGGKNLDSRLSLRLESGLYFLKVKCLDDEPDQPYTISIEAE